MEKIEYTGEGTGKWLKGTAIVFIIILPLIYIFKGLLLGNFSLNLFVILIGILNFLFFRSLFNLPKNTMRYLTGDLSKEEYRKKRRNCGIVAILLVFTSTYSIISSIICWVYLNKTKYLLSVEPEGKEEIDSEVMEIEGEEENETFIL